MKKHKLLRPVALITLVLGLAAAVTTVASAATENKGQLSARDYKFVCEAVKGGAMEVFLGQLAADQGTDPSVRQFGQRMVQDHQKANQELTQLATQKGATLPDTTSKKDEKMTAHLQSLSGAEFDKAYIKNMVRDHKKDIKEFQTTAQKGDDADLKNWAGKTLPTLEEHLRLAESAESAVVGVKVQ